jgi:hypothetical protein
VQRTGKAKGKILSVRFDREDEMSGTTLRPWQWARLVNGAGAIIAAHPAREA